MGKGFTLIELLVVVLIIGILAAVALPEYRKVVLESRYVQAKTLTQAMANSAKVFYMENGAWTLDFDELALDVTSSATHVQGNLAYFRWGYCQLGCSGQCGGCYVRMQNTEKIGYWDERFLSNKRACIVPDDTDKIVTDICQSETNKSSGSHSASFPWTAYWYD